MRMMTFQGFFIKHLKYCFLILGQLLWLKVCDKIFHVLICLFYFFVISLSLSNLSIYLIYLFYLIYLSIYLSNPSILFNLSINLSNLFVLCICIHIHLNYHKTQTTYQIHFFSLFIWCMLFPSFQMLIFAMRIRGLSWMKW